MSEQTTEEKKIPSKDELIAALQEQIEVKSVQLQLQELNTKLASLRADELKAYAFIGQMTSPEPELTEHVVSQQDMDENPDMAEHGIKVGDTIQIPATKERKLRKA